MSASNPSSQSGKLINVQSEIALSFHSPLRLSFGICDSCGVFFFGYLFSFQRLYSNKSYTVDQGCFVGGPPTEKWKDERATFKSFRNGDLRIIHVRSSSISHRKPQSGRNDFKNGNMFIRDKIARTIPRHLNQFLRSAGAYFSACLPFRSAHLHLFFS